ncbi:sh3 domain-containing protein c23a1.17 [Anaeramoeba flamelloides]|uniref:Sh3 domain-containing protein c23a1.17 n=1 Tax=Anaeramoeba flamelloides TaxID=1746091 RepID=A0AAV7ZEM6_9EUKA|nr:sh3 domain-containing protein c23a1.17 [Anaeramoeba flamelloides]
MSQIVYKVIKPFKATLDHQLTIKEKETVVSEGLSSSDEWIFVWKAKDPKQSGYVPATFLERSAKEFKEKKKHTKLLEKFTQPQIRSVYATHLKQDAFKIISEKTNISKDKYQKSATEKWETALKLYQQGKLKESIFNFKMVGSNSKVFFNIALIHIQQEEHRSAIFYLNEAIKSDKYFALGFFMRGNVYTWCSDNIQAVVDHTTSLRLLRINNYIDYRPLGIDFVLHKAEVLFNRAYALMKLNLFEQSLADLAMSNRFKYSKKKFGVVNNLITHIRKLQKEEKEREEELKKKQVEQNKNGSSEGGKGKGRGRGRGRGRGLPLMGKKINFVAPKDSNEGSGSGSGRGAGRTGPRRPIGGVAMGMNPMLMGLPSDPREILRQNKARREKEALLRKQQQAKGKRKGKKKK